MSTGLAIAALVVAALSALFAYRATRAANRSAAAAEATDRRDRTPKLAMLLSAPAPAPGDRVIYTVRNDGPQDLDHVVVHRPRPTDRITYPIAVTGGGGGWADDEIDLGPVALGGTARFTLCCGAGEDLPELRVRIECRAGRDQWAVVQVLPTPRGGA